MATAKDFKTDTNNDLFIDGGDFAIFESDKQHIVDIITSAQGSWKEYPLCGVGLDNYLNSSISQQTLRNSIVAQLSTDGYGSITVDYNSTNDLDFSVDAIRG